MTENKPIMIDVVDVSGCELYRNDNGVFAPDGTAERTELCYLTNDYCGNNTNCYYKQLARKTQECEKKSWEIGNLGYKIKNQRKEINERLKQLTRKRQECEELRTDIKDIANLLDLDTGEEYNFGNIEIAIKGLKQECERWKNNFNGKVSAIEDILQQLDQLKADINKKELIFAGIEVSNRELIKELNQLKAENETYKKMLDNLEVRVALTDIRSGERDLWQKYKPRMEQAEQKLEKIENYIKKYAGLYFDEIVQAEILQIIDEVE